MSRAILTDTRIAAELWLNGEGAAQRSRLHRLAEKRGGECRRLVVRLADGFEIVTGTYIRDDAEAAAAAIRVARSRAMEIAFRLPPGVPFRSVWTPDGQVRTRACPVAPVVSVTQDGRELWPAAKPPARSRASRQREPSAGRTRQLVSPMTGARVTIRVA